VATQGFSALDKRLGRERRDSLMANFGTMFFFANRERATDEEAFLRMGYQPNPRKPPTQRLHGRLEVVDPTEELRPMPVCMPGNLAQLAPHQAYVSLADGSRKAKPVWLEPVFLKTPPPLLQVAGPDDLAKEVARLRASAQRGRKNPAAAARSVMRLMQERGRSRWLTASVVESLFSHCEPQTSRQQLLENLKKYSRIENIETLPNCWLKGLGALIEHYGAILEPVAAARVIGGVLCFSFRKERTDSFAALHELANTWVYPNLWRPAKKRHLQRLWAECPDLRGELQPLLPNKIAPT
jgi:hypothetical protein